MEASSASSPQQLQQSQQQHQQQQQPSSQTIFDIQTLEEAVIAFYRSDSGDQQRAHLWLNKAQSSQQAWSFVWQLMQPNKSSEIQFFGATTLHWKLVKYWHEIPKEYQNELKEKLLEAIIQFGSGPKIVLNRLCISLSAFIVQMIRNWPSAIQDVIHLLKNQQLPNLSANTQIWIMMEVLTGIPEEANAIATSSTLNSLQAEVNKDARFVLSVIEECLDNLPEGSLSDDNMNTCLRTTKCAGLWIKNNAFRLDSCNKIATALLNIVSKCYWNSTSCDGCMSADENELAECCLETLAAMMTLPDSSLYPNTALALLNMFLDTLSHITKAEWVESNLNEDIAVGIYTLFVVSMEWHSKLLLNGILADNMQHQNLYQRIIHEILQCTNKPGIYPVEESCSTLAMGFWYMLQDEVISNDNEYQRTKCLQIIHPLYSHLSKILVYKARQPDEISLDKWSTDDLEAFRCYRQDITDTLMHCYDVLHDHLLDNLEQLLNESMALIQTDPTKWTQLEACFYAFYSIAEHICPIEHKSIPHLMKILNEIPYENLTDKLLGTALNTIGAYSEWFKENPNYLPSAVELLVKGLNSTMAAQATLGLKDLCRDCQTHMHGFAEPLVYACQQALLSGQLKNTESVRLMFSIGKIMSMLQPEKILPCLDSMVSPCFEELQQISQNRCVSEQTRVRTVFRLNMIATLFSSLNTNIQPNESVDISATRKITSGAIESSSSAASSTSVENKQKQEQPVLFVMQKTMPIFRNVGEVFINELYVIDALCNALKHAITNLMSEFRPMLPDLCGLIVSILPSEFVTPAIELSQTCLIIFWKDDPILMRQLFLEVISYSTRTFGPLTGDARAGVPDLVESFWRLMTQVTKKLQTVYDDETFDCDKLIKYAIKHLFHNEAPGVKNTVSFLNHFIIQSSSHPRMSQAILENGAELVRCTLICFTGFHVRSMVEIFADILLPLNKVYPLQFVHWMKVIYEIELSNRIQPEHKAEFSKSIIKEKTSKRMVQAHIRMFFARSLGILEIL